MRISTRIGENSTRKGIHDEGALEGERKIVGANEVLIPLGKLVEVACGATEIEVGPRERLDWIRAAWLEVIYFLPSLGIERKAVAIAAVARALAIKHEKDDVLQRLVASLRPTESS